MIRFVQSDYARLLGYFSDYSMQEAVSVPANEVLIKRAHRCLLAALQIWASFEEATPHKELILHGVKVAKNSDEYGYLSEYFSDLMSSVFSSFHGLYKPAFMSARSAIEVFVRGGAGVTSKEVKKITSVYQLFDIASVQPLFCGGAKPYFDVLRMQYGELCSYTHTAGGAHMAKKYAFASFPAHNTEELKTFVSRIEVLVESGLAILIIANARLYLDAPDRAKELLDQVVPSPVRLAALGA